MTKNKRTRSGNSFLIAVIIALLSGCSAVGPDYIAPTIDMPGNWNQSADPAFKPDERDIRHWWIVFDDPMLTNLIDQATEGNLDLQAAFSRVKEARARLGIATGELYPEVDAEGSLSRQKSSENDLAGDGSYATRYRAGIDASWEIDLFGRIRRSIESAEADLQVSEEDRIDVMTSLYAEIALTYFSVRTFQARLDAATSNIESQKQVLSLTESRFKHGLASGLDVAQARQVLANTEAEVPPLRRDLTRAINTIGVLIGRHPGVLYDRLSYVKPIPVPPEQVTVGVPANILRQRPDIRGAERGLAAQTARIGVATADLYPEFALSGSFFYTSVESSELFDWRSSAFSIGPFVRWNVFDADRIRNQIKVEDARTEQALLFYEQTVLTALNEVENSIKAYREERFRVDALETAVEASQRALKLSLTLYKEGLIDFQRVLDAQRELFGSEDQLATSKGTTVINLVQLYKALGGGWNPVETLGADVSENEIEQVSIRN
jgi:NodT family efflux transporter outer membrane factor (OMF) lipoprotein